MDKSATTPQRSVRTLGTMKLGNLSPTSESVDFRTPVWRKIRDQIDTPAKNINIEYNLLDSLPSDMVDELNSIRRHVPSELYRIYEAIFHWLNRLLHSTALQGKHARGKSLLAMCLRKIPACIADIDAWDRQQLKESGVESVWGTSNAASDLFDQLEALGSDRSGWRPLRLVVRSQAVYLLSNAISDGLFRPEFCNLLVRLCIHLDGNEEASQLVTSINRRQNSLLRNGSTRFSENRDFSSLCLLLNQVKGKKISSPIFECVSALIKGGFLSSSWLSTRAFSGFWISSLEGVTSGNAKPHIVEFMCIAIWTLARGSRPEAVACCAIEQALIRVAAGLAVAALTVETQIILGEREQRRVAWRRLVHVLECSIALIARYKSRNSPPDNASFLLVFARYLAVTDSNLASVAFKRRVAEDFEKMAHKLNTDTNNGVQYQQTIIFLCTVIQCRRRSSTASSQEILSDVCSKLARQRLPEWFGHGLQKDVAFMLAQKTEDLRDLTFAESLPVITPTKAKFSTIFSGWRWEEGISEWVLPSPRRATNGDDTSAKLANHSDVENEPILEADEEASLKASRIKDSGRIISYRIRREVGSTSLKKKKMASFQRGILGISSNDNSCETTVGCMEGAYDDVESLLATSNGQAALDYAIQAAELYMRAAAEKGIEKSEATRLRRKCQQLIAFAEQLKVQLKASPSSSPRHGLNLLRGTSRLHGSYYPPWSDDPSDSEFQFGPDEKPFVDDTVFTLSENQIANFSAWRRPHELFGPFSAGQDSILMTQGARFDLAQDITTDCSVVASLSAAAKIWTGKHAVLSTIMYPFDRERGQPKLSPSGKYIFRLNFNGCTRRVTIDDRLPASGTDRALFVINRHNPRLIWPALLEKAYLKVRGGYDFPGSNSGTDLWVLTGWIPEQLFLQREDFDIDEVWNRIKTAYDKEDVIITLGTGHVSTEEEDIMGLVGEHDYAVQDLDSPNRKFLVKNPWSHGQMWTGQGWSAAHDSTRPRIESLSSEADDDDADSPSAGTLWLAIEDIAQHFESMYLNWNPTLFTHRQDRHFTWEIPTKDFAASLVRNPQFSVISPTGGSIWILLSRHFADAELEIARNKSGSLAAVASQLGFMSILIFDSQGYRVQFSDGPTYSGPYVDSPQTLARIESRPGKAYTVVIDQQALPLANYTFSLSIFSNGAVHVQEAEEKMTHVTEQQGAWNRRTSGGNSSCTTYFLNPQYKLSIPHATPISTLLATSNKDIHVHLDLIWARGKRVHTVKAKDLVVSSGEYRRGCAIAELPTLEAGDYTLVCSTFEAQQMANFTLRIASMTPVTLEPIPADTAGKLRTPLSPFTLRGEGHRWRASIDVSWVTRATISIRSLVPSSESLYHDTRTLPAVMIRISIIDGSESQPRVLAESKGGLEESGAILRTPEFDIEPSGTNHGRRYLLIESLREHRAIQELCGDVFSDSPIQIGDWEA
ncbi:cysteine protease [Trichoderma arundinaceum]|uniref:Cysteine protease n=1 Tax=Trichoderma arundinaceum TaxID=490622 RepID=A0A395NDW2_TRIAR|nr:cysteine protease [Trichoderma arundinaceum]